MRKLINHILIIAIIFALPILNSCSSDDDSGSANLASVTLDGQSFAITSPVLVGVTLNGEGHIAASLTNQNGNQTSVLTIDFEYTTDQSIEGDYVYPETQNTRSLTSLTNYTEFISDSNTTETKSYRISKGTFTLKDNGEDNYTLTMDLLLTNSQEESKSFKGTYTGDFMVQINNGSL